MQKIVLQFERREYLTLVEDDLNRIIEIDTALSTLFDNFGEIVRRLDWQEICLLSDHTLIKQQNYPGIYRINIRDKRTVAIKLKARRMWHERVFRLSTIHLPVTHYELIAPRVESELRSHVNPLVGRQ